MKISIISNDKRYEILNQLLNERGYQSRIVSFCESIKADALILPIKSAISDNEYKNIFLNADNSTLVFSPQAESISKFFKGRIIEYPNDEDFLEKNAYITAECALQIILCRLEKSLSHSKILVLGYGRIGKALSNMLSSLNADVYIYARRLDSQTEALRKNLSVRDISCIGKEFFDVIVNTVPCKIVSESQTEYLSKTTVLIELASSPGGFENEKNVEKALGLPGKMKSYSAALAIYDFINKYLSSERI